MELRTTPAERELHRSGRGHHRRDLTDFVVTHTYEAAKRVLADRDHFELDDKAPAAWEALNARPSRDSLSWHA